MKRPYIEQLIINDTRFIFSSAYSDDYLIVQENNKCIAVDITDRQKIDELIAMLKNIKECE